MDYSDQSSIMHQRMQWLLLLDRSGLTAEEAQSYFLKSEEGPDEYWAFWGQKPR